MTTIMAILTGGGLAVVGGLFSGLLTNWLGDKRDQRKYEHERTMAGEARRQDRLERAYLEMLAYVAHHWTLAMSIQPFRLVVKPPESLPPDTDRRVWALVEAYGSSEVRGLFGEWITRSQELAEADVLLREVEESNDPSLDDSAMREKAVTACRDAMFNAGYAIEEQVRRELAGHA